MRHIFYLLKIIFNCSSSLEKIVGKNVSFKSNEHMVKLKFIYTICTYTIHLICYTLIKTYHKKPFCNNMIRKMKAKQNQMMDGNKSAVQKISLNGLTLQSLYIIIKHVYVYVLRTYLCTFYNLILHIGLTPLYNIHTAESRRVHVYIYNYNNIYHYGFTYRRTKREQRIKKKKWKNLRTAIPR